MNVRLFGAAILFSLLSACAFVPQTAELQPVVRVSPSDIGAGVPVAVTVVDERANTSLGRRGNGALRGAEIHSDQDMVRLIEDVVAEGLASKGFRPVRAAEASDAPGSGLRVDLRALEYSTSTGFFTGGVHVEAALKASVMREDVVYERVYRIAEEERTVVVPNASYNEKLLNTSLESLLLQMLEDEQLLRALVQD